ncbi:HAD hydrolase family protein [Nocardioides sp.]|uniref:HAD family hydrolase n=1 Tax=Nocardioides sp. TaxID=35761 RepID=UPI00199BC1F6|nr:HAD hydrolase family protein [Nocardioides sp.]MBC7277653.1 HAD hydrolase family protein [Nocardioides sp.]
MSTLILSDLDGTLLGPGAALSTATRDGINDLLANGLQFSYATARSYVSAARVADGLDLQIPVTVSGGAFQLDPHTGAILNEERIPDADLDTVLRLCREHRVPPIVYNGIPTAERAAWVEGEESDGMRRFLADRVGDSRFRPTPGWAQLPRAGGFYATIIGEASAIAALTIDIGAATDGRLSLIAQIDTHHPQDTYLELSAARATKAHAVAWLRDYLNVARVIVYGDNLNDLPMFRAADQAYAVANAAPEVLAAATGVIGANTEDGVLHHLVSAWSRDAPTMRAAEMLNGPQSGSMAT